MDIQRYEQARLARDPRFDGRFFIGVKTTGIYCRPVCKVKMPLSKNITFYKTAASAAEAGFRPCLRCRPEASPGTPAWIGTSTTVRRALRLISEGVLDTGRVSDLADRLGVTTRHLSRLFEQHIGASPKSVGQTRRLHLAKKLLDETDLSIIDVAMSAGYQSVRRFNDHFKSTYHSAPGALRKLTERSSTRQENMGFALKLAYRPPFDFLGILAFLKLRAIPGVEEVSGVQYSRTITLGRESGRLTVTNDENTRCLRVSLALSEANLVVPALERVKRIFDLDADPIEIHKSLKVDSMMASLIDENPGQRIPGCWDPFEIAVRAIVGQQVSVKGATTVMGRIALRYGEQTPWGLRFPDARALSILDTTKLSMPIKRAQAIKDMSALVAAGKLCLDGTSDASSLIEQLTAIRGIGPWTAQYITMRALGEPDAFLHSDLVLLKVAKSFLGIDNDKALLQHSLAWQPWRAYAGMHLWRQAAKL